MALAYMSDRTFIGTAWAAQAMARKKAAASSSSFLSTSSTPSKNHQSPINPPKKLADRAKPGMMVSLDHTIYFHPLPHPSHSDHSDHSRQEPQSSGDGGGIGGGGEDSGKDQAKDRGMARNKDNEFRADEWLLTEMDSPWAGDGRGLVTQRIWDHRGRLVGSCFQEVGRDVLFIYFFSFWCFGWDAFCFRDGGWIFGLDVFWFSQSIRFNYLALHHIPLARFIPFILFVHRFFPDP